jgi:hypothetical protein
MRVSYLRNVRLVSQECASPFYLICTKKEYLQIIRYGILLAPTCSMPIGTHTRTYVCQWARGGPMQEAPRGAQAV